MIHLFNFQTSFPLQFGWRRQKKLSTHCKGQIGWNRNNLPFTLVIPKEMIGWQACT
jgi:hypothetical protein